MEFGIAVANIMWFSEPDGAVALAQGAEAAGFDSIWTVEHVLVPEGYQSTYPYDDSGRMPGDGKGPIPDPLIWLAYLAHATTTLKLGTGILIVPQRNPAILAKELASLQVLSRGRVLLGVGSGWLEEEFDALKVPFEKRGQRLDAYIEAMRALWGPDEQTTVHNDFVDIERGVSLPKPPGNTIPVVIGGHTKVAARRAGRLGDGFFPGRGTTEELRELIDVMRKAAEDAGRDPDAIEVSAGTEAAFAPDAVDQLQELEALGISRVIVPPLSFNPADIGEVLAGFGERVIAPMKG
jgi:probable F420-dependent oxidoreductase